jgi:hypothetical protein
MAVNPAELEQEFPVFDINAACRRTSQPILEVCDEIIDQLQEIDAIGESGRALKNARLCAHEVVKDMVYHADETEPRVVFLEPRFGGVAIRSFNMKDDTRTHIDEWGDNPYHNGRGEAILAGTYGRDYMVDSSGDSHERQFLFRGGAKVIQFPRIRHNV